MSDFTLGSYEALLSSFREAGYYFVLFGEIEDAQVTSTPFVLLRHDIEVSLEIALEMAKLENRLGIRATYFVFVRSPIYNLLSFRSALTLSAIHELGHDIGLHIDLAAITDDSNSIYAQVETLCSYYPFAAKDLVSLHSPKSLDQETISSSHCLDRVYGVVLNGQVEYISDSTAKWRFGHPLDSDAFRERRPIQLLTHPIWWIIPGQSADDKLKRWLELVSEGQFDAVREEYPKIFLPLELP